MVFPRELGYLSSTQVQDTAIHPSIARALENSIKSAITSGKMNYVLNLGIYGEK